MNTLAGGDGDCMRALCGSEVCFVYRIRVGVYACVMAMGAQTQPLSAALLF